MTWDGTRWVQPRRSAPSPQAKTTRDWIATGIMVIISAAILLPLMMVVQADTGQLTLTPSAGAAGQVIVARVIGLGANERVQLEWDGDATGMPASKPRAGNSTTILRFVVPEAGPGRHIVTLVQDPVPGKSRAQKAAVSAASGTIKLARASFDVVAEGTTPSLSVGLLSSLPAVVPTDSPIGPSTAQASSTPLVAATPTVAPTSTPQTTEPAVVTPRPAAPVPTPVLATPVPTPRPTPAPTPAPPTFSGARPVMPAGATWADSFDGSALNPGHWGWDMAMVGTNDNMNRYAMFSTDPRLLAVSNGTLKLKALRDADGSWKQSYISTRGKYMQQYGIFRASMKIPAGHALWPAFWTLDPTRYDEMDVIEAYPEPGNARYTFCMINTSGRPCAGIALPADYSTAFHVYEMEWRPGVAIARLDGREVARHAIPEMRPQFLLLQMGVGVWFKNIGPDGSTPTNPALEVDWVGTWP